MSSFSRAPIAGERKTVGNDVRVRKGTPLSNAKKLFFVAAAGKEGEKKVLDDAEYC